MMLSKCKARADKNTKQATSVLPSDVQRYAGELRASSRILIYTWACSLLPLSAPVHFLRSKSQPGTPKQMKNEEWPHPPPPPHTVHSMNNSSFHLLVETKMTTELRPGLAGPAAVD